MSVFFQLPISSQKNEGIVLDLISKKYFEFSKFSSSKFSNHQIVNDSCFYVKEGKSRPSISYRDYLERIKYYVDCSAEVIVISLIYFERMIKLGNMNFEKLNFHKIAFVSIMLATKFYEDEIHKNKYYAQVAGVSGDELLDLEKEFLEILNFNLFVREKEFDELKSLINLNKELSL